MALDPAPGHPGIGDSVKLGPEILIYHRRAGRGDPALSLPAGHPLGDATANVLTVGDDGNGRPIEGGADGFDGGPQLHPVVGRPQVAATKLDHPAVRILDVHAPAAGARIANTRSVGV